MNRTWSKVLCKNNDEKEVKRYIESVLVVLCQTPMDTFTPRLTENAYVLAYTVSNIKFI